MVWEMVQLLEIWIKTGSLTWKDLSFSLVPWPLQIIEGVYVTTGNPAFCLFLYLTGVHFRGELQHGGDVSEQNIKCRPIRTWETGGVSFSDVLYAYWSQLGPYHLPHAANSWLPTEKAAIVDLKPSPNLACCGCWWLGSQCFTNFPYDSPMVPTCFPHVFPMIPQLFLWVPGWFPVVSPRFPF